MSFFDRTGNSDALRRTLALGQGVFYLLTGIWPLLHIRSFMAVTGPKHDVWLVKTVGTLIAVIGTVLVRAGLRPALPAEIPLLAAGSAAALTAVDVIYVTQGTIAPIYLLDAAVETVLVAAWLVSDKPAASDCAAG
jgi:hypothetical protein